jgi:hypothetical protein
MMFSGPRSDPNAGVGRLRSFFNLNRGIDVPAATGILIETTGTDLHAGSQDAPQVHRLVPDATKRQGLPAERDVPFI